MKSKRPPPNRGRRGRFEILYEDQDLLVICKDPGLLTNSYKGDRKPTAERMLTDYLRKGNNRSWIRAFVVHRLDKETSGLLIFAKNKVAQQKLMGNWKTVEKHYTAVVHGRFEEQSGRFASYLAENNDQVVYSTPDATKGKWSETFYRVVKETPRFSQLDIKLLTGRKNQIRVHLAEAGHPIAGDAKYGKKRDQAPRMALHARTLAFPHPHNGRPVELEAPVPAAILGLVNSPDQHRGKPFSPGS
jgi:tRNA pseudouridine32 synthase/23S rRNA pseudouridine746 synthase/23S rRNA pseudouridine1911/1915/1917 synthase